MTISDDSNHVQLLRKKIDSSADNRALDACVRASADGIGQEVESRLGEFFSARLTAERTDPEKSDWGSRLEAESDWACAYLLRDVTGREAVVALDSNLLAAAVCWAITGSFENQQEFGGEAAFVERNIARPTAQKIGAAVFSAFRDEGEACGPVEVTTIETSPDQLDVDDPKAPCFALNAKIQVVDGPDLGKMICVFGVNLMPEIRVDLKNANDWRRETSQRMMSIKLPVHAVIGTKKIDYRAVTDFVPGKVIPLENANKENVALEAGSGQQAIPLARGVLTQCDGSRVVTVSHRSEATI